jgi:hypothetical protein
MTLTQPITQAEIEFFTQKAAEKIQAEGWYGRNKQQKQKNFINCWITEEAFKKLLVKNQAFFRHRALYVGDAAGAGVDFEIKSNNTWTSVGIRSIGHDSAYKWKSVAYPEDRFLTEKEKIPEHVVACTVEDNIVKFLGIIRKQTLLDELEKAPQRRSKANQEYFRSVSLDYFSEEKLQEFLMNVDKR